MIKIRYEHEGKVLNSLDSFTNSLKRGMIESIRSQVEDNINADLAPLRTEMETEGGQFTATITLLGDNANIGYQTEGFSDDLDRRIFKALGLD